MCVFKKFFNWIIFLLIHRDNFKHNISIYNFLFIVLKYCKLFRPKYIDLDEDADNLTPENFASFPSKMTFSWFDSFAWTGWKRKLTIYNFSSVKKKINL